MMRLFVIFVTLFYVVFNSAAFGFTPAQSPSNIDHTIALKNDKCPDKPMLNTTIGECNVSNNSDTEKEKSKHCLFHVIFMETAAVVNIVPITDKQTPAPIQRLVSSQSSIIKKPPRNQS